MERMKTKKEKRKKKKKKKKKIEEEKKQQFLTKYFTVITKGLSNRQKIHKMKHRK